MWVTADRLKKTETPRVAEFSNLELAFASAGVDCDVIEVRDNGIHLMRDPIHVKSAVTLLGVGASKPTISLGAALRVSNHTVFNINANTLLENMCVKTVGGDKSKTYTEGGCVGVLLSSGELTIESCRLLSDQGSAVVVPSREDSPTFLKASKSRQLVMQKCSIGPCGRSGIILDKCYSPSVIREIEIKAAERCGIACNKGDAMISGCVLRDCGRGIVLTPGSSSEPMSIEVQNCTISKCRDEGISVGTNQSFLTQMKISDNSTIEQCGVAMKAVQDGVVSGTVFAKIIWCEKSTIVKECTRGNISEGGAQIMTLTEALPSAATKNQSSVLGDVHAAISDPAPAPQSAQKDASPPAASVKSGEENNQPTREAKGTNSLNVSAEKTNYARYLRLLMDVGKEVLLSIFKASYKKQEKKLWTDSSGPTFLDNRFSGPSQRQLGKHLIDNIRTVTCEKWDITLLSSLLLFTPGYIKDSHTVKIAVEKLLDQRNALAHSADFLAKQSLADKEFQEKWEVVARELRVLAEQLLPEEKGM